MPKDIGAIFKKIFKGKKAKSRTIFGNDPRADWQKIVIAFLIINLLVIGWSAYLFWQINQGDIFEVSPGPTVSSDAATRNNLRNILTVYGDKEKHFEELRLIKPVSTDPAI